MGNGRQDVLVVYGGRSAEHEVSCRSAAFVLRNLDPDKYDVRAIAIGKDGQWLPQNVPALLEAVRKGGSVPIAAASGSLGTSRRSDPAGHLLALADASRAGGPRDMVVFPILHGTFGEDGTMQGLLEMAEVAFVGPDTLGSAVGMDKVVSKKLAHLAGVPVVPWLDTRRQHWDGHAGAICDEALRTLGLPLFVKPVRQGSSVGVTKVRQASELRAACDQAFAFDDKIMIEKGLDVREIEIAALGDYEPMVSVPGEVIPHAEFYSYDAKYVDANGASRAIPADLTPDETRTAQELARKVFVALELYGMTRIDLFLEKGTGAFYFNEVNTIPGFTEISQYPLLWKASGVSAQALLDQLIALAVTRRDVKRSLKRAR